MATRSKPKSLAEHAEWPDGNAGQPGAAAERREWALTSILGRVANFPSRTSYDWPGGRSLLATAVFWSFWAVRLASPLQWLKYFYRWHGLPSRVPRRTANAGSRVVAVSARRRPDVPPALTELYFLLLLALAIVWSLAYGAHAIHHHHGAPHTHLALLILGWLIVVESLQWILYYLIVRTFSEPNFTLFHPAENLLVFPLVVLMQCAVIADLAHSSLSATTATMLGDAHLSGSWKPFVTDLGRLYLAVAVVALVHSLPPIQSRRDRRMIAVVGAGEVTRSYLVGALRRLGYRPKSIYLFDDDPGKATLTTPDGRDTLSVRILASERIVDEIVRLDLPAIVATPTDSHLLYASSFAACGVHFAVEKPLCVAEREQLQVAPELMRHGFAFGYYVLEKALPLTYFCTLQPAYREFLVGAGAGEPPPPDVLRWARERLGALRRIDVMLLEGSDRTPPEQVRLWTEQPPALAQLVELAIHPLQLVCMLTRATQPGDLSGAVGRVGRSVPREELVRELTGVGIAPTFFDVTFKVGTADVALKVGRHIPDALCGRRLHAEWEHGEAFVDFDARSLFVAVAGETLTLSVGRQDGGEIAAYDIQLRLFERARNGEWRAARFDELASQLQALKLWEQLCAAYGATEPVGYDNDTWPAELDFTPTPARPARPRATRPPTPPALLVPASPLPRLLAPGSPAPSAPPVTPAPVSPPPSTPPMSPTPRSTPPAPSVPDDAGDVSAGAVTIQRLAPRPIECFYAGGARLAAFRGCTARPNRPEEWLASAVARANGSDETLTALADGRAFADDLHARPQYWLGPNHVAAYGADPALLVKLLDVGGRLPVHAHPDAAFARAHLGGAHGKTEAWVILACEPRAAVYLGLAHDVSEDRLLDALARADAGGLIASLNRIEVRAGDVFFVPAGMLHSIDAGVFLLELQEPTDYSLIVERGGTGLSRAEALLGLAPALAVQAVERRATDAAALAALASSYAPERRVNRPLDLLPDAARRYFSVQYVAPRTWVQLDRGFAVGVVLAGCGTLATAANSERIAAGEALLVPWAAGPLTVSGDVRLLWARPPLSAS